MAAGAFGYPFAVGSNVEAQEAYNGPTLSAHDAAKAALLGVPEAAIGAYPFARVGGMVAQGVKGSLLHEATSQAAAQAVASAGQDFIAQQMGDPNRKMVDRMSEMMQSILTGGVTGALMGAGVHALAPSAKTPPPDLGNKPMADMVDAALGKQLLLPPPEQPPKQLLLPPPERTVPIPEPVQGLGSQEPIVPPAPPIEGEVLNQRLLPPPERVATVSPDLESDRVHEPTNAAVTTGFDAKGNPILGPAPIELGPTRVGEPPVETPSPPPVSAVAEKSSQTEQTVPPVNPMDEVREAAKGRLPQPVKDLLADPKATPEALETLLRDRFKSSEIGGPVSAGKPLLDLAKHIGVLDGDGNLNAPKAAEPANPAVAPLEALRADPEVQASPTLAAKVGAALDTAKTPTPSPAAVDIVAKLLAAKPKTVAAPTTAPETIASKEVSVKQISPGAWRVAINGKTQEGTKIFNSRSEAQDEANGRVVQEQYLASQAGRDPTLTIRPVDKMRVSREMMKTLTAAREAPPPQTFPQTPEAKAAAAKTASADAAWLTPPKTQAEAVARTAAPPRAATTDFFNQVEKAFDQDKDPLSGPRSVQPQTQAGVDMEHITDSKGALKDNLAYLQRNGGSGLEKTVANMLLRHGVDAPMRIADDSTMPATAGGQYDPASNTITLRPGQASGQLVLHEAVHAATTKAIEAGGPAAKDMTQLYDTMKARSPDNDAYGLQNVHEFVAEAHTNPEFQDFLRSHPADPSLPEQPKTLWQAFKNVVAKIIGARDGSERTMLDQVLETGNRLMGENKTAPETTMSPVYSAVDRVKKFEDMASGVKTAVNQQLNDKASTIKPAIQNMFKGVRDAPSIVRAWGKTIPSMVRSFAATKTTEARTNTWSKVGDAGYRPYATLDEANQQAFNNVAAVHVLGIDGRKPWEAQDPTLAKAKNAADLKARWSEAYRDWNRMAQTPGAQAAYGKMVDTTQLHAISALVQAMDAHVKALHPTVTQGFETDPGHVAQNDALGHDDPTLAKATMLKELTNRQAGIDAALNAAKLANKGETPAKLESLERFSRDAASTIKSLDGVPHFRLSHGDGDYFVSGALRLGPDGLPDQGAINEVNAAMEAAGFKGRQLEHNNANNALYTRTNTPAETDRLTAVFRDLQATGALSADKEIGHGPSQQAGRYGVGPAALHEAIAAMERGRPSPPDGASKEDVDRFNASWDQGIRDVTRLYQDLVPSSSFARINAKREDVQGYSKAMGESFREGVAPVSRVLAKQGMAAEKGAAIDGMRAEIVALKHSDMPTAQITMAQNAVNEMMLREMQSPISQPSGFAKMLMGLGQRMEIGTNPMYFLTLLTQNLTLSLPRLGSTVGFLQAAKSMGKATVPSFDVMRAMLKGPDGASAGMRMEVLTPLVKAGKITQGQADHLIQLDNQGAFHQSMTHAMTEHTDGAGWFAKVENWSRAMGLYAELQPRLQMALAARDAHAATGRTDDVRDFSYKMVDGSQLDWSRASTPRYVTAMGPFGAASPLMNQFMGYRIRLSTMLYHEMHDMIGGDTSDQRKAAGLFLAGHLAATTVLAGALGLPMVSVMASVYDKLADTLTGNHDHDIIASFRNHLSDVFGKPVAEAIARGAPRLAGLDLSHLGDQKIAPGSDMVMLLTEKRKFEDAEKDWLKNMAGSAVGMLAKDVLGLRDMSNGDYLRGAMKMAPEAMRGPIEALQQSLYGYRSMTGQKLQFSSNAATFALTAMGLDPSGVEEYNEANNAQLWLQIRYTEQTQNVTQHLALALSRGDMTDYQKWVGTAEQIREAHPGLPPIMSHLSQYLQRNYQQAGIANSMGLPIGVKPNDLAARGMLRGYNLQGQ